VSIKVVCVGLGPIGAGVVKQLASRKGFRLVGAVDIDPAKVGRDAGDVCGVGRKLRVPVTNDIGRTLRTTRPDAAVLCTSSSIKKVVPEIAEVLKLKVPVVSTTEELAYPVKSHAAAAKKIDALARRARVAVLGTGVNPGFTMDALPIALTGVCEWAIEVDRIQDARIRRLPFQKKIGAGLTRDEFMAKVKDGSVRHVGLAESITMIAEAMGWRLDRITDEIQPKIAEAPVSSEFLTVDAGLVCGLVQDGIGSRKGEPIIKLHMEAYLGAPETYDATRIIGHPMLSMKISGGVHGDIATASIAVNSIPKVMAAAPGLRTMRDIALPSFFAG
jgi:4-hydroxy-tetrahydrodipicolinate reductase